MDNTHPSVGVFPDKYVLGITSMHGPHLDRKGQRFSPQLRQHMTLREALETDHHSDAHMTCYCAVDENGKYFHAHPMFRKDCLASVRDEGADVHMAAIGFDWDTPGHAPLTDALFDGFLASLGKVIEAEPRLGNIFACYSSAHGTRLFYQLASTVPVDEAEQYITTMLRIFKDNGLEMDQSCRDWTRRFRLPRVVRRMDTGGRPTHLNTWEQDYYRMDIPGLELDITTFEKSPARALARRREFTPCPTVPSQQECDDLLHTEVDGRVKQTEFYTKAKRVLKPTTFYDLLTNADSPMPQKGRNNFIMKMLGVIVPRLLRNAHASVEEIFALLYGPLCQWEAKAGQQDPHSHAWNALQDIYAREVGALNEEQEREEESADDAVRILSRLEEGMKEWCDHPDLHSDDIEVRHAFVRTHLLANTSKFYFPLMENGRYSALSLEKNQLVSRIRKTYLDKLIVTRKTSQSGEEVSATGQSIADNHSTVVNEARMSPSQDVEGIIEDLNGTKPVLTLSMYKRRTDLEATYNPHVDGWLRAFFGQHYDQAAEWLGYALDFEAGPICALSIMGPSGTGKKLLSAGLSECLVEPVFATGEDVTGSFNDKMLRTPFLHVNEGWPSARGQTAPSDMFKSLTAGDAIHIRPMYRPGVNVLNPMRILLTANDHDLIHELTRGKELTPESKRAVGERLLHFDIDNGAVDYLRQLGGPGFTAAEGNRWIRGDFDEPSDYIVAKHFLWLYENRPERDRSQRLCVMGNCSGESRDMFQMVAQSGNMSVVLRVLAKMVESIENPMIARGLRVVDGNLYVTKYSIYEQIKESEGRITEKQLETCLKGIVSNNTPREIDGRRFFEVDVMLLREYALEWGMDCSALNGMMEE